MIANSLKVCSCRSKPVGRRIPHDINVAIIVIITLRYMASFTSHAMTESAVQTEPAASRSSERQALLALTSNYNTRDKHTHILDRPIPNQPL